jgi:carbamoyltransferase
MNILGISAFYHDSAACLVRDGMIVAAAQEERFTRKKHDRNFPGNAVDYCLSAGGITSADLDAVAFYDKPFLTFERLLETYLSFAPAGLPSFLRAMPLWLKKKLWMGDEIRKSLAWKGTVLFPEHHQSHAASAFFPSPFQEAAIITLDGVGEWATGTWGTGRDNRVELCHELRFPHSLGLLYSAFTYYTGFRVNSGEYKLMGLAPYGEPVYRDLILERVVNLKEDGSFRLNMRYFNYCQGLTMTSRRFNSLFGSPPRKPESPIRKLDMDIAASIQAVTEEIVLRIARHVRRETGMKNLCLAGGVALNCVANGKILRENLFDKIWIQPAAGDAGGALGAALFAWHQVHDGPRQADGIRDSQKGSYLGPRWSTDTVEKWLQEKGYPFTRLSDEDLFDRVAEAIDGQKVVGWFGGRMEFGPRALGNRSILGDARSPSMQRTMNLKIKYREGFRPFAPSAILENAPEYFDLEGASPYMLLTVPVRKEMLRELTEEEKSLSGLDMLPVPRSKLPAITHVNNSARIQTVSREDNPRYHRLLSRFRDKTGCAVVINTSFNVRGEPIVCTPRDAYLCFMRTEMDALALENCLLLKEDQPPLEDSTDWRSIYELD